MNANAAHGRVTPIELEIIYNALTAAAAEMDITIWRTSRSRIVRELLDYSTAIFDRDGWNVAQAARIPSHLNSMSYFSSPRSSRSIFRPTNGAPATSSSRTTRTAAASTCPISLLTRRCFATAGASSSSARCVVSTSAAPRRAATVRARRRFFRKAAIPPVKIVEDGKLNAPIRAIILQNVRQPDILWGDLQSQLASLDIGAASVERLVAKLGEARFEAATRHLLDRSEAAMRAVIGRIPDGTYEFEDHVDDDGISDAPIRIHAKLTVAGDELTVDLSGCSPQVMGPSNATLSSTCSTVFYALIASADVRSQRMQGAIVPSKFAPPGCASARPCRRLSCIASPSAIAWPRCCSARCIRRCRSGCRQPIMPCPMS